MTEIKTGDLLFFPATGWIGRLICFATKSKYCHVGIAELDQGGEVWLHEYREFGNRMVLLSAAEHEWKANADVWRHARLDDNATESVICKFGRLPKEYGYFHFLLFAFYVCVWRFFSKKFVKRECNKHSPTCSESVCRAYREGAGIDLVDGIPDRLSSPGDIIRGGKITKV